MGKKKSTGLSKGQNPKIVMQAKKSYPSRYADGLASEDKIIMKENVTYMSRYK